MGRIFGTDGIRDRAGQGFLARDQVTRVARAVGHLLSQRPADFRTPVPRGFSHLKTAVARSTPARGKVLIGRDTRASGPEIENALADGFRAQGLGVAMAGVVTTPGVAYLTRRWGCAVGVVISASHNPADDNGIKFISPQGFKIPDAAEEATEKILESGSEPPPSKKRGPSPRNAAAKVREYLDFLVGFSRPLKGMRIVADCGHGASSALAGPLFKRLGAKVVVLNASPDGRNINAGCGALHPEGLVEAVRREKADAGVAFDGDADRAIFADENGEIRDGEHVLALAGLHLKEQKKLKGNRIVSTVMANFGLERFLAGHGIALTRTKVGDKFVAEEMLKSRAVLGGEPSGHVLFFDAAPAGDGMLTALRVFDILRERGKRLSETAFSKFPQILINVPVGRKPPLEEAAAVQSAVAAAEKELGSEGRILVRYSGTESLCRVMVEGPQAAVVDRLAASVADVVKKELA